MGAGEAAALDAARWPGPHAHTHGQEAAAVPGPQASPRAARAVCRRTQPPSPRAPPPSAPSTPPPPHLQLQIGLAHFHDDVFLTITYSNFLIEVQSNYQSGVQQLQNAKKLEPSISDRFAIFVREQVGGRGWGLLGGVKGKAGRRPGCARVRACMRACVGWGRGRGHQLCA